MLDDERESRMSEERVEYVRKGRGDGRRGKGEGRSSSLGGSWESKQKINRLERMIPVFYLQSYIYIF